jgi:hypothetical protein
MHSDIFRVVEYNVDAQHCALREGNFSEEEM